MGEIQDLRRRRQTLETQLAMLAEQRERGVRANGDALSLQRAGVPHHDALAMKEPAARRWRRRKGTPGPEVAAQVAARSEPSSQRRLRRSA
jgi:hypothetical protein